MGWVSICLPILWDILLHKKYSYPFQLRSSRQQFPPAVQGLAGPSAPGEGAQIPSIYLRLAEGLPRQLGRHSHRHGRGLQPARRQVPGWSPEDLRLGTEACEL